MKNQWSPLFKKCYVYAHNPFCQMGVENLLKASDNVGMFHTQGFFQIVVRGRGVIPLNVEHRLK